MSQTEYNWIYNKWNKELTSLTANVEKAKENIELKDNFIKNVYAGHHPK